MSLIDNLPRDAVVARRLNAGVGRQRFCLRQALGNTNSKSPLMNHKDATLLRLADAQLTTGVRLHYAEHGDSAGQRAFTYERAAQQWNAADRESASLYRELVRSEVNARRPRRSIASFVVAGGASGDVEGEISDK